MVANLVHARTGRVYANETELLLLYGFILDSDVPRISNMCAIQEIFGETDFEFLKGRNGGTAYTFYFWYLDESEWKSYLRSYRLTIIWCENVNESFCYE